MPPLTFGFRALESYRAAVVKVGHLTIPFPIHTSEKWWWKLGFTIKDGETVKPAIFTIRNNGLKWWYKNGTSGVSPSKESWHMGRCSLFGTPPFADLLRQRSCCVALSSSEMSKFCCVPCLSLGLVPENDGIWFSTPMASRPIFMGDDHLGHFLDAEIQTQWWSQSKDHGLLWCSCLRGDVGLAWHGMVWHVDID